MTTPTAPAGPPAPAPAPPFTFWKYVGRLAPAAVLWFALLGWLGWLLYARAHWSREADEADVREWLNQTRVFRKSLPELVREYDAMLRDAEANPDEVNRRRLTVKHAEIEEHLRALAEPTRVYSSRLPLYPEVYSITVDCPGHTPPPGQREHPAWRSPVRRPTGADEQFRTLRESPHGTSDPRVAITCEYRVHTFNTFQRDRQDARTMQLIGLGVLVPVSVLVVVFVVRFLLRERDQEVRQWRTAVAAEHQERELLEARVKQQDAERANEDLARRVLQSQLDAAKLENRAAEAERAALELKSQLYAGIGIMAGSYAHNIKNLLVRPNDLLSRCMEADGMGREHQGMLQEVKATLGTVTERLQQILRTVRRDPSKSELTRIDLSELVRETFRTWTDMAWEKWKVRLTADPGDGPLVVNGDLSHLQQAVENLVFNARDATFEMRNHFREEARRTASLDSPGLRQKLIEAAAWKGEVSLQTYRDGDAAVLEVRDNGIGMTAEVRENCLRTHFTTKRDNALYEGYSAGMGLGLSFVAVVLDHHHATLDIESAPLRGALFRVRLPLAGGEAAR
jgi:signal transduction histidine kinase